MEIRIAILSYLLAFLLGSIEVRADDKEVLKDYKAIADLVMCRDVMLPCIPILRKDADLHFAVFSEKGELIAITKMHEGVETVVWGKLPLRKGEQQL